MIQLHHLLLLLFATFHLYFYLKCVQLPLKLLDVFPLQFFLMTQILQLYRHGAAAIQRIQTRPLFQTADQLLFGLKNKLHIYNTGDLFHTNLLIVQFFLFF